MMNTKGMDWFLKDNKGILSEEYSLKGTKLIVDRNELPYVYYRQYCGKNDKYYTFCGLVCFKTRLIERISQLKEAQVELVVVFGGSISNKLSPKRFVANSNHLPSPLLELIFMEVLEELEMANNLIELQTNRYSSMVELANKLQCPILTSHVDFLFHRLDKGFILVDENFKDCLFSQRKLIEYKPGFLEPNCVPLLALLIQLDEENYKNYNSKKIDPTIRSTLDSLWTRRHNFKRNYPMNNKIARFLMWLQTGQSYNHLLVDFYERLEDFLHDFPEQRRPDIRNYEILCQKLGNKMADFVNSEPGQDHNALLWRHYKLNADQNTERAVEYLHQLFCKMNLNCFVYNLILHNNHYECEFLDDCEFEPQSRQLRQLPYSVALSLLRPRPYDRLTGAELEQQIKEDTFVFGDQIGHQVEPARHLEHFGSLDGLFVNSLVELPEDEKRKLLLATFRCSCDHLEAMESELSAVLEGQSFVEVRLLLILLRYIKQISSCLEGTLMSAIIQTCVIRTSNEMEAITESPDALCDQQVAEQLYLVQSTIEVFCTLNTLLGGQIFPRPNIGVWFDGPLMLRLIREMRNPSGQPSVGGMDTINRLAEKWICS